MTTTDLQRAITSAVDASMVVTLIATWLVLVWARRDGIGRLGLAVPIILAALWGAAWIWFPPLAALRLAPPPGGQVLAIFGVLAGWVGLLLIPSVRTYFRTAEASRFVALGPWRIVYGAGLLALGASGGIPAAFYVSAGIGDILVGLWSLSILSRRSSVSTREVTAWNIAGVMDFTHVLALGAINLRPFYLANPDVPSLNMLPLVGVPIFFAMHILALWGLSRRRAHTAAVARTAYHSTGACL
jgi:hypothetical protein